MAEPGQITATEARNLLNAIVHADWIGTHDLSLPLAGLLGLGFRIVCCG